MATKSKLFLIPAAIILATSTSCSKTQKPYYTVRGPIPGREECVYIEQREYNDRGTDTTPDPGERDISGIYCKEGAGSK